MFLQTPPEADATEEIESSSPAEQLSQPSLRDRINQERLEAQKEVKVRKAVYSLYIKLIHSNESEMRQRERLLNTYGFDVLDTDENGDLIYRQKAVSMLLIQRLTHRLRKIPWRE